MAFLTGEDKVKVSKIPFHVDTGSSDQLNNDNNVFREYIELNTKICTAKE